MREHLQREESQKTVERVREIYAMFTSGSYSCDQIYREMNACIAVYLMRFRRIMKRICSGQKVFHNIPLKCQGNSLTDILRHSIIQSVYGK